MIAKLVMFQSNTGRRYGGDRYGGGSVGKLRWWLAGLVLVVGVWWSFGSPLPGSSPTPAATPTTLHRTTTRTGVPPEQARGIDDFARMCGGGKGFSGSPAYQGNAPHPIVLFPDGADEAAYANDGVTGVPNHLVAADTVQLVACMRSVATGPPTVLRTCQYEGGRTATLLQGHWRFDVYQARTGRPVTSMAVDGDPGEPCRPMLPFDEGSSTNSYYSQPGDAQNALLDALVTGPVH
jgi:hypothetical protein